jgi:hypothetical protein
VPLRSGSLYPGSENDAAAYRDANLIDRLRRAGLTVVDDGDVDVPSHERGLRLDEGLALLSVLMANPRIRVIEVAEYAALRDVQQRSVLALIDLLAQCLPR